MKFGGPFHIHSTQINAKIKKNQYTQYHQHKYYQTTLLQQREQRHERPDFRGADKQDLFDSTFYCINFIVGRQVRLAFGHKLPFQKNLSILSLNYKVGVIKDITKQLLFLSHFLYYYGYNISTLYKGVLSATGSYCEKV